MVALKLHVSPGPIVTLRSAPPRAPGADSTLKPTSPAMLSGTLLVSAGATCATPEIAGGAASTESAADDCLGSQVLISAGEADWPLSMISTTILAIHTPMSSWAR